MKKLFLSMMAFLLMLQLSNAQIKVFPSGNVSYGNTTSPTNFGVNHYFTGSKTTFAGTTASITSAPLIRGINTWSAASYPDYTFYGDDNTGIFHSSDNMIGFSINASEKMRIHTNGNVGIGVTAPTYKLQVSGNFKIQTGYGNLLIDNSGYEGIATITPETHWYGNLGSTSKKWATIHVEHIFYDLITDYSDYRIKENIVPLTNSLDKVMQLNGRMYDIKADYLNQAGPGLSSILIAKYKNQMGFIAQEVQTVFPQLVFADDSSVLTVNYIGIIPVLVEAIKELKGEVTVLEKELNNCCAIKMENGMKGTQPSDNSLNTEQATTGKSYLMQNKPNPFNNESIIEYNIADAATDGHILVFDMTGKLLKTYTVRTGKGSISIGSSEYAPGMYYYSLIINGKELDTKRMILSK